jgi:CO/xanthine dehydrogenase FAD-binding subunit
VALGSAGPVPLRARAAEAVLQGRSLAELAQALPAARAALMADISPIDDIRSTAHYRRVTAGNLLEQMVGELLQGAGRS